MMERVPRYTSYPTAPNFHEGIGVDQFETWLDELGEHHTLSLYFHIPYCQQLCWFCGCHTKVINHYEPMAQYLELLEKETRLITSKLRRACVNHIHFGGGSPTVVRAEDFTRFMTLLRNVFSIAQGAEIAIEIDPRTVDAEKISTYANAGVTRASLGVQDFTLQVQEAINRVQPYRLVCDVVKELRHQGIRALNIDLIYGLPYQTLETTKQTLEQTLSLEPDRISLFGYAHVPWMKKHQQLIPEDALPDKASRIAMFETAATILRDAGYIAIGLDHFAKSTDTLAKALQNRTIRRNFQGYTTDMADALLGLGVSSISSLPQGYVQNSSSIADYARRIKTGMLPIVRGIALTNEDIKRHNIIMSLMCHMYARVPQAYYSRELQRLEPYFATGDVIYTDGDLYINPAARNRLRLIASVFDDYLSDSLHRYSQAM